MRKEIDRYKILSMSDSILGSTGFGTATRDLMIRLSKNPNFEIHNISWNYWGLDLKKVEFADGFKIDFPVYCGGQAPYAQDILPLYLNKIKPEILYIQLDSFMLHDNNPRQTVGWLSRMDLTPAKLIFHFPSDGEFFPQNCENVLKKCHTSVAMSKFARDQVADLFGIQSVYIPLGVNTKHFYPYPDKNVAKVKFGLLNKFVIGTVARNQGRKHMGEMIKVFAKFAKDKNDVILLMHSDPNDNATIQDLIHLINRYQIGHKCMFTGMSFLKGFTLDEMKDVYNAMDIFILTTSGEGFGIPVIEAMSCEVPVVITDYTTSKELVYDWNSGLLVKLRGCDKYTWEMDRLESAEWTLNGQWCVERAIVDNNDFVIKLNDLYSNPEKRAVMGKNGRKAAIQEYDWDLSILPRWEKLLKEVLE